MNLLHPVRTVVVAAAIVGSAACAASERSEPSDSGEASSVSTAPHEMTVVARDFAFEIPDTVPAGVTTIRMKNEGPDLHHFFLVKLADGKTLDNLLAETRGDALPDWAVMMGGPNSPVPGGEAVVTVDLEPGNYAALCVIPAPDGIPHVAKGMSTSFTVVPGPETAVAPTADIVLTLSDYDFTPSMPITAGKHLIDVRTDAPQSHEVFIVQLAPGKSLNDFMTWMAKPSGPPPGKPLGGTVGISPNRSNLLEVDLQPGDYALICFFPDKGDGKPHFMHGMMKQITVS